jgi:hypothetical protein
MNPVDDFLKEASFISSLASLGGAFMRGAAGTSSKAGAKGVVGKGVASGLGQAFTGATALTLMTGAAVGASRAFEALEDRLTKTRDYKAMLQASPALSKYDAGQVQMVFNSLRAQAPSMSKDPLIASSFIRKTLEYSPESGPFVDPQTAKTLTDVQGNINKARNERGSVAGAFKPTSLTP